MSKKEIMIKFYEAFQKGDFQTMNSLYDKSVVFNDPIFKNLNYEQVTAMWTMLLDGNKDMKVDFNLDSGEKEDDIRINWIADYHFGPKKRKVHNDVYASMEVKNDKIISHTDSFVFWVWAKQSLGFAGRLFGHAKWFNKKVSKGALEKLTNYINTHKK